MFIFSLSLYLDCVFQCVNDDGDNVRYLFVFKSIISEPLSMTKNIFTAPVGQHGHMQCSYCAY